MTPQAELALLLRPAAGGLYLVSTGRAEQIALQERLYGVVGEAAVQQRFLESLGKIATARGIILGIPSDTGGGLQRGANLAPQAIRRELLHESLPDGVVDIGDVIVVPQLLHDSMLSESQKRASRRALFPSITDADTASRLPVSPLSIAERVMDLVFALNPGVRPFVLGGDHSCAWPIVSSISRANKARWGIVQPDAHTDLLEERLGVKYCFGTWSYHANELLGRDGRLVQVGTRASRFDRAHWERTLGVRQLWADECRRDPSAALEGIIRHLKSVQTASIYFSNDIDGTDSEFADATGTPEPGGLSPDFVVELIRRLGREIGILGGDIMEVAPGVCPTPDSSARTVKLGTRYLVETIRAAIC